MHGGQPRGHLALDHRRGDDRRASRRRPRRAPSGWGCRRPSAACERRRCACPRRRRRTARSRRRPRAGRRAGRRAAPRGPSRRWSGRRGRVSATPRRASAHRAPSGPVSCTPMSRTAVSARVPVSRSSCWARSRRSSACLRETGIATASIVAPGAGRALTVLSGRVRGPSARDVPDPGPVRAQSARVRRIRAKVVRSAAGSRAKSSAESAVRAASISARIRRPSSVGRRITARRSPGSGRPLDQAALLQAVGHLGRRPGCDVQRLGQVGEPDAVAPADDAQGPRLVGGEVPGGEDVAPAPAQRAGGPASAGRPGPPSRRPPCGNPSEHRAVTTP